MLHRKNVYFEDENPSQKKAVEMIFFSNIKHPNQYIADAIAFYEARKSDEIRTEELALKVMSMLEKRIPGISVIESAPLTNHGSMTEKIPSSDITESDSVYSSEEDDDEQEPEDIYDSSEDVKEEDPPAENGLDDFASGLEGNW